MDYEAALDAFFAMPPGGAPQPRATQSGAPARRLRDAIEPIGAQPIWSREANERYAALGLDFLTGYASQRSSALGTPAPDVVVSAFGVFSPGLIVPLIEEAQGKVSHEAIVEARELGTTATMRRILGDVDPEAAEVVEVLDRGLDAADWVARPLFAGLSARPDPQDVLGRLVHACDRLREHRGDSHLAACASEGLGPVETNILTELYCGFPLFAYTATRAWSEEQMEAAADGLRARGLLDGDELSSSGMRFREDLERLTDKMQQPILDAIGDDLDATVTQLETWSAQIVAAGGFPPDPSKRAAG